jgi:hypothetical protein
MKKLLNLIFIMILFCVPSLVYAQSVEYCIPSTAYAADAKVVGGAGKFYGISVLTDGVNSVTVTVYDNTAASGTKIINSWVVVASSSTTQVFGFDPGVQYNNGIYVDVTLAAGTVAYTIYYTKN